jgi:hypothetical protein
MGVAKPFLSPAPCASPEGPAVRCRSPTPAPGSVLHAGESKEGRKRDAQRRLSEPVGERRGTPFPGGQRPTPSQADPVSAQAPWGAKHRGDCREQSEGGDDPFKTNQNELNNAIESLDMVKTTIFHELTFAIEKLVILA